MPLHVFQTALNDLQKSKYQGRIHLYLMGEPLCDPRIEDLIRMARKAFPQNVIFISTNGDHLNGPKGAKKLVGARFGFGQDVPGDYNGNGRFADIKEPRVVVTSMKRLERDFYNRAGHVDVKCSDPKETCDWVFGKGYINYRGDVILCCSDYNYEVVFGNIMDERFIKIYNSDEYRKYKKEHAQGRGKTLPLCERCDRIQ